MKEHDDANTGLDSQLRSSAQVALPWESTMGFVRPVSNERVFPQHCSVAEAWQQVQAWLAQPNVSVPTPTPQHARTVGELVASGKLSTKDVPDIHLAALAISHGPKLASHNRGSARFDGLRWIDPIGA